MLTAGGEKCSDRVFRSVCVCVQSLVMDFNLLTDGDPRSPALSLSDSGTPQHDPGCKGLDQSGQSDLSVTYD